MTDLRRTDLSTVIPAKAGTQRLALLSCMEIEQHWIPACAGMTVPTSSSQRMLGPILLFASSIAARTGDGFQRSLE
ncbi:hypothetical protein ASD77_13215 [Pseudoxanthomonas sp. Root65]|nr:hypothetical protein ASD77_13215 [Pseudoxanthomonas sp. Root65]